jgi:hypothetical protein
MTNRLTTRFSELEAYGRPGFVALMRGHVPEVRVPGQTVCGRGDKDVPQVAEMLGVEL